MNTEDVKRAAVLVQAVEDAKQWRETFEENGGDDHEQVEFAEVRMTSFAIDTGVSRQSKGFDGSLALLRPDAIALMDWIGSFARTELASLGVDLEDKVEVAPARLVKIDPNTPALKATGRDSLVIKAGTIFGGRTFAQDTDVTVPDISAPGVDYVVTVRDGVVGLAKAISAPDDASVLGGFHFAPGGNATADAGGDDATAINPCSLWDRNFRPTCADPRGMALIETGSGRFWADIYLTGVNHLADGTSRFGVMIADGDDCPLDASGKKYPSFDYETARAVMVLHGKGLMSIDEFRAAAFGVTEKTAAGRDPKTTGLDAPRTSRFGLMQATGNLWIWGHDGDRTRPRASVLGGSWFSGGGAGSRRAGLDNWTDFSPGSLGARGRSDHLQLAWPPRQRRPTAKNMRPS